jgi:cytochrome c
MVRLLNCVRPALSALICGSAALLAAPASAADVAHGKLVFTQQCAACHSSNKGGATLVGPNLYGVVDRRAGAVQGYAYSPALKGAGLIWTSANLNGYLEAPARMLPGVRMPFGGIKNPAQRDDLVAYLQSLR